MVSRSRIFEFFLVLCAIHFVLAGEYTLKKVQVLTRHGDRTPVERAPKIQVSFVEDRDVGQLSSIGMKQHYELGQKLRERYVDTGFLDSNGNEKEIYVRSSDADRCIVSADSLLMGLYPNKQRSDFDAYLPNKYKPIPIHTVPTKDDTVLRAHDKCEKHDQLVEGMFEKNEDLKELFENNKELIAKLAEVTGMSSELHRFDKLSDFVMVFKFHNRLNETALSEVMDDQETIDTVFALAQAYHFNRFRGLEMGRLTGGNVLKLMIDEMQKSIEELDDDHKFMLYSAHDSTIMALFAAMGLSEELNRTIPPYASHVEMQLYENEKKENFVRMLYNDEIVSLTDCDEYCPFNEFVKSVESGISSDWNKDCSTSAFFRRVSDKTNHSSSSGKLMGVILLASVMIVIGMFIKNRVVSNQNTAKVILGSNSPVRL